jgi:hypothetical protein
MFVFKKSSNSKNVHILGTKNKKKTYENRPEPTKENFFF